MADINYAYGDGSGFLAGDQYDPTRVTKPSGEMTPGGGVQQLSAPDPFAAQRAAYDPSVAPAGPNSNTLPASWGGQIAPGQVAPSGESPHTVYTDASGRGYDPAQLQQAMQNPAFMNDPLNARTRDIIQQYGVALGGTGTQQYGGAQTPASPAGYQGTGVFSDPATSQYEKLLNGLISRLNTNYTPPSWGTTMDSLNKYISQLNGPAYTNQQMDLFNTQAIDPIFAQRDADNQAIIRRFAAQGMGPDSGPVQAALMANNQKYGAQADQARAQIASQGVNTQKQQQAAAMGYQLQIPTLETGLNSYNLGNAEQAAQYAGVIPNLAWSRLSGAQNSVGAGANPLTALQLLNQFQNTGYNQGADYAQNLQAILPYLLKMFGLG